MKRYLNEALLYAVLSLVGGVFYREFTKIHGFVKKTTLEVVHTHYFILGMIVLLLLLLLSDSGTRNRSFFRHGRCYLRYGWHRTHPSGSKLGSLVTSDPAQHI